MSAQNPEATEEQQPLEWSNDNVRIHLLAHFISQNHKDHPSEGALVRHPRRLLLAIDECPAAVTKAEDFICAPRGTLKNWVTHWLVNTTGPQLSESDQAEIYKFLISFAEKARYIPTDLIWRCFYFVNRHKTGNDAFFFQTIKTQCRQVFRSQEFKEILARRQLQLPTQRKPSRTVEGQLIELTASLHNYMMSDSCPDEPLDSVAIYITKMIQSQPEADSHTDAAVTGGEVTCAGLKFRESHDEEFERALFVKQPMTEVNKFPPEGNTDNQINSPVSDKQEAAKKRDKETTDQMLKDNPELAFMFNL